ncbi:MAG TPA: hypothetical protein DCY62_13675, partial [Thalassospira sp.]|nr:hypothetical protein [Thalassospira sp.]
MRGYGSAGWLRIGDQGIGMSESGDIAGPGTRHRVGGTTAIEASGCGGRDIGCWTGQLPCSNLNPGFGSGLGLGPGIRLNRSLSLSLSLGFMLSFCFNNGNRRTWDARCLVVQFEPWRARAVRFGGADLVIRSGRGDRRGMERQAVWRRRLTLPGGGGGVGDHVDGVLGPGRGDRRGMGRQAVSWLRPYLAGRRW